MRPPCRAMIRPTMASPDAAAGEVLDGVQALEGNEQTVRRSLDELDARIRTF